VTAQDHLDILDLYSRYNLSIDSGDADAWADCFIWDGHFHHPAKTWSGSAELRRFVEERTSRVRSSNTPIQAHWNNSIAITGDERTATGSCELMVVGTPIDGGCAQILARGRYADNVGKSALGWQFSERRLTLL
jgi:hypothetical protein